MKTFIEQTKKQSNTQNGQQEGSPWGINKHVDINGVPQSGSSKSDCEYAVH